MKTRLMEAKPGQYKVHYDHDHKFIRSYVQYGNCNFYCIYEKYVIKSGDCYRLKYHDFHTAVSLSMLTQPDNLLLFGTLGLCLGVYGDLNYY